MKDAGIKSRARWAEQPCLRSLVSRSNESHFSHVSRATSCKVGDAVQQPLKGLLRSRTKTARFGPYRAEGLQVSLGNPGLGTPSASCSCRWKTESFYKSTHSPNEPGGTFAPTLSTEDIQPQLFAWTLAAGEHNEPKSSCTPERPTEAALNGHRFDKGPRTRTTVATACANAGT